MLHQQSSNRNSLPIIPSKPQQTPLVANPPPTQTAQISTPNLNKTSSQNPQVEGQPSASGSLSYCSTSLATNSHHIPSTVLLQTALVKVIGFSGSILWARALLDPASQLNILSETLAQRLQLPRIKEHHTIGGIGQSTIVSTHSITTQILSHCCNYRTQLKFQILKSVTRELPANYFEVTEWNLPTNIVLADPQFNQPGTVDMIIGVDSYYDLLLEGLVRLGAAKPVLQNTLLGWVVSGRVGASRPDPEIVKIVNVCTQDFDEKLARFWELESCQSSSIMSVEESTCEAHLVATTTRDASGRFMVELPLNSSVISFLGNSYEIAKRRFLSLEHRIQAKPQLKVAYTAFLDEYLQLGHMKKITDISQPTQFTPYYIPPHCVERPDSLTTKLRVVFDASCVTDTGISLNDALMAGPVIQDDLVTLILRVRIHRYVLVADIEKMYRQILMHPRYQCLLRILWREDPTLPIQIFELTSVTYGTSSAPFQATRCLQELSKTGRQSHPYAAEVIGRDFYMDDLLTGCNDVESGKILCTQLLELLGSAGFQLRKWSSNSSEILDHIPKSLRDERNVLGLDPGASIKTLGLGGGSRLQMSLGSTYLIGRRRSLSRKGLSLPIPLACLTLQDFSDPS